MKKYLILFLVTGALSFTSCSDDDEVISNDDPIVGTWALVEVNPASPIFDPALCDQSTITLNDNGTATATFYLANAECQKQQSGGNWSKTAEGIYQLTVPFLGTHEINVDFGEGAEEFNFNFNGTDLVFRRQ